MLYYKKFEYSYDKQRLLDFFNERDSKGITRRFGPFLNADHSALMGTYTPLFDKIGGIPNSTNFGLAKLDGETGMHCTPRNNGILILPVEGSLVFDFYSYVPNEGRPQLSPQNIDEETKKEIEKTFVEKVVVDQPTAINGLKVHNFYPQNGHCIFYGVKISTNLLWDQIIKLI